MAGDRPQGDIEPELARLARACGLALSYVDAGGRRAYASRETCVAVLRALGIDAERPAQALAELSRAAWSTPLPPVLVSWGLRRIAVAPRLPRAAAGARLHVAIEPRELLPGERAEVVRASFDLADLDVRQAGDGVRVPLVLPGPSGLGEHELVLECAGVEARATVLAAPERVALPNADEERSWGLFLPLHALRTRRDRGMGDLGDLAELCDWAAELGASFAGVLPLAAVPLDSPVSPYMPSTRRAWNERYVALGDPEAVPDLAHAPRARERLASADFRAERARLAAAPLVDHEGVARLERGLLEELHRALPAARRETLARFLAGRPDLAEFARFRAVEERERRPWRAWPARLRDGRIEAGDHDPEVADRHAYAQLLAAEQLAGLGRPRGAGRVELYLDLPLGVHPDGYDTWSARAAFAQGLSIGAPPDLFFASGQDWGLPAPDPLRGRAASVRYLGACLRHHFSAARWLRYDHVMGLHRLWVIPHGAGARDGVYLRQPADELYAVLCLEARRAGGTVVGEDLGTVPPIVRERLARHGVLRMHVLPFEVDPARSPAVAEAPRDSLASLGTHDTPTFVGYWSGADLAERGATAEEHESRRAQRTALVESLVREGLVEEAGELSAEELLRAALLALAGGPARALLVGIEDLLLEPEPQNRPGTLEATNWRRRSRLTLEELRTDERIAALLRTVDRARGSRERRGGRYGS